MLECITAEAGVSSLLLFFGKSEESLNGRDVKSVQFKNLEDVDKRLIENNKKL